MPYTHDKLAEAQFFLARFAESPQGEASQRFYFSALVSASRAVSWVLRKEYRGRSADAFDQWWPRRRVELDATALPFQSLVAMRNAGHKEGNLYPREHAVLELDATVRGRVEVYRHAVEDTPDRFHKVIAHFAANYTREELIEAFTDLDKKVTFTGFTLLPPDDASTATEKIFSQAELTEAFGEYLRVMRDIVADADSQFPAPRAGTAYPSAADAARALISDCALGFSDTASMCAVNRAAQQNATSLGRAKSYGFRDHFTLGADSDQYLSPLGLRDGARMEHLSRRDTQGQRSRERVRCSDRRSRPTCG